MVTILFYAGQWTGRDHANLHRWGLAKSVVYECGQQQTTNYIVDMCPLTKFEGGLQSLQEAEWNARNWLLDSGYYSTREITLGLSFVVN